MVYHNSQNSIVDGYFCDSFFTDNYTHQKEKAKEKGFIMAEKDKPKTEEELRIEKMKEIFETLLFEWLEACKKTGFGVSYLISVSVHGSEKSSSDSLNFKHGYAIQLQNHLKIIDELVKKEVVKEIGKKNFN